MTYYRVKADCDQRTKYVFVGNSTHYAKENGILVAGELYTPAERKRIANADKFFEKVRISSRKTYWFFGVRFEKVEV